MTHENLTPHETITYSVDKAMPEDSVESSVRPPRRSPRQSRGERGVRPPREESPIPLAEEPSEEERIRGRLTREGIPEDSIRQTIDNLRRAGMLQDENAEPGSLQRSAGVINAINGWMATGMSRSEAVMLAAQGHEPPPRQGDSIITQEQIPEVLQQLVENERPRSASEVLRAMVDEVLNKSDDFNKLSNNAYHGLRSYVSTFADEKYSNTGKTYMEMFNEILTQRTNLVQAKVELGDLLLSLVERYTTVPEEEREEYPESFDEYLRLVMKKETDDYRTGGMFELISADGTIRYENLSAWAWSKALWWDGFSPDNAELSFFSSAAIPLNYRTITLNDFITDPKYKRRLEERRVLDKNGRPATDPRTGNPMIAKIYHDDADRATMVGKIIDELWFLNQSRNAGVLFRLNMGQDEDLAKNLGAFIKSDTFTRANGLEVLFSTSGLIGENYLSPENGIAGELAAVAENVYDKIFDLKKLQHYLGKDSTFFRRDFLQSVEGKLKFKEREDPLVNGQGSGKYRLKGEIEEGKMKGIGVARVRGVDGPIKWNEKWYDENGVLKTRADGNIGLDWVRGQFLDYVNIFNEQNKDSFVVEEVRERIRQSLVEKVLEKNSGILGENSHLYKRLESAFRGKDKYKDKSDDEVKDDLALEIRQAIIQIIYRDATRAEATAFTTTRWLGVAGMNDTTATGWDASTKWYQTADFRQGQSRPTTIGTDLGNPRTIGIYKRVMAPLKEGIRTRGKQGENRKTPQRVIEEIAEGFEKGQNGRDAARQLRFNTSTMVTYDANHLQRGKDVFAELASGLDFDIDKIITWDFTKGFTTNIPEFTKQIKNRIKQRRYLISGYTDTDYENEIFTYRQRAQSQKEKGILRKELAREQGKNEEDVVLPSFRVIHGKEGSLGSEMLGKQVFNRPGVYKDSKTGAVNMKEANTSRRNELWREAWLLEVAAGIAAHRDRMDMSNPMGFMQLEGFYEILAKIPANIYIDPDSDDAMKIQYAGDKYAITEDMINYIRKVSKTGKLRMLFLEGGMGVGAGAAKGFLEILKAFAAGLK